VVRGAAPVAQAVCRIPPEERPAAPSPPSWRKRDVNEGFRIVATGPQDVRRLNRRWAQVLVPKLGWVRSGCPARSPTRGPTA
jgi:hypothetical protein